MIRMRTALALLLLGALLASAASLPLDATPAVGLRTPDALCENVKDRGRPVSLERRLLGAGGSQRGNEAHKPLLPTNQFDVAMLVLAAIVLFIAAGAGMGGGPVLVPLYLTLGAFHQQAAVALSNRYQGCNSYAAMITSSRPSNVPSKTVISLHSFCCPHCSCSDIAAPYWLARWQTFL